jgi:DNA-binding transcriptional regulator LsrR (DeoR family)
MGAEKKPRPGPKPSRPAEEWIDTGPLSIEKRPLLDLTPDEQVAQVCKYFCQGFSPTEIAEIMRRHHGVEMTREVPYKYLKYAASKGWLQFVGPRGDPLSREILGRHRYLQKVEVVPTGVVEDVAARAAAMLVEMLREHRRGPHPKDEVHIGFAGGHAMRRVAKHLADQLIHPIGLLPQKVFFHALVAGFDWDMPVTDPNAFFLYFFRTNLQVEAHFVALHAPALVRPDRLQENLELPGIREAAEQVNDIDIFVSSAAVMVDEHSMMSRYLKNPPHEDDGKRMQEMLQRDGCVGDMLWQPLSRKGPIKLQQYPYRSLSIVDLDQLPAFIRRGRQVLLMLAPCGQCRRPKTEILQAILELDEPLITHLVVDSPTARSLFADESMSETQV